MSESISAANTNMQLKDYAKNAQRERFGFFCHDCKGNQSFFELENNKLNCHYKQEESLQELYHENLKLICCQNIYQNIVRIYIIITYFLYSISLGSQNGISLIVEINI